MAATAIESQGPPPPRPIPAAADSGEPHRAEAEAPRILIVEDEYLVALELESELTDAGFAVVGSAATADEAIRLASDKRPTLIVMDVRLPGQRDGIDAAIEIYRATGIRSIFATAYPEPQLRRRAQAAAALAWLPKPYQMETLVSLIRKSAEDMRK
ncbi:MAG TPA: response regulator [Stellaceae bacterium]|nr:response regulator [Stellaceae bacterium]